MSEQNNTVDSMLPIPKLFAYGLQHVLAMYAGAVAVPIIIAQAMHLPVEDLIRLITADLFTCGIATLIPNIRVWQYWWSYPDDSRCNLCLCWTYGHDRGPTWYDRHLRCHHHSRYFYILSGTDFLVV